MDEGGKVYACRFSVGALYGMREIDLIEGVKPFNPLDVLDAAAHRPAGGRAGPCSDLDRLTGPSPAAAPAPNPRRLVRLALEVAWKACTTWAAGPSCSVR